MGEILRKRKEVGWMEERRRRKQSRGGGKGENREGKKVGKKEE